MDQQIKGGSHDSVQAKNCTSLEDAILYFEKMKEVFLNINSWDQLFKRSTEFHVKTGAGIDKKTPIQVGDFVAIKIPGPQNRVGDGYDWVQIVSLEMNETSDSTSLCLALQPAKNPHKKNSPCIAHFFTAAAKNYFIIKKEGTKITAEVHGRNEVANYQNIKISDKLRNFFIAKGGIFGLSKIQWEVWSKNMVDEKILQKCIKKNQQQNH